MAVEQGHGGDQLIPRLTKAIRVNQRFPEAKEADVVGHRPPVGHETTQEQALKLTQLGVAESVEADPHHEHEHDPDRPQHLLRARQGRQRQRGQHGGYAVEKDDRPARTQPEPEEAVMDVVPIGGEQPRAPNQAPQQGHHDVEDRQRKRQQRRGDRDGRGGLHGSRDREGRQGEADEE